MLWLIRRHPWAALTSPLWLLKGKAYFKDRVAAAIDGDVEPLPYRDEVVTLVREHCANGGEAVLATAANSRIADRVAAEVGLFSDVLASDATTNLSSDEKRRAIERYAQGRQFDYVGDRPCDVPIWQASARAIIVPGAHRLARRVTKAGEVVKLPEINRRIRHVWARQLRVHQWFKNVLLAVPLLLAHQFY
ncbi:MAG: haloacid dehalogenase-like hydrolase, partial [Planctomycetota bacterium]